MYGTDNLRIMLTKYQTSGEYLMSLEQKYEDCYGDGLKMIQSNGMSL